jgi:integrase
LAFLSAAKRRQYEFATLATRTSTLLDSTSAEPIAIGGRPWPGFLGLVEGPDGPVLAPTKTRRSHRVALDPATLQLLRARFDEVASNCPHGVGNAFVFTHDEAGLKPWNPNWVTKQFIAARKSAGLGHFRLHDLRHFMATQMLNAGIGVPVVSARLAHARASTTLNV